MIIWLSGATGSGKTSLANLICSFGYKAVREEAPNHLFTAFVSDPEQHCEAVQEAILRSRHTQYQLLTDNKKVVFDRSLDEDLFVFCQMHHALGYLDKGALSRLEKLNNELKDDIPSPDLILYLSPEEATLRQRMVENDHPPFLIENLRMQMQLYDEWISGRSESIIKIDNSKCQPSTLSYIF